MEGERTFKFTLTGKAPLLMHADSVPWSDQMKKWSTDAKNAKKSVAGDDRTPAFRWVGYTYNDGKNICIPADILTKALTSAGAKIPAKKGRGSFKHAAVSEMEIGEDNMPLLVDGKPVKWAPIEKLIGENDFEKHEAAAKTAGFELDVRRAAVNQTKHIRVRPMFREWSIEGQITVFDDSITDDTLKEMFDICGRRIGLGDWRPSSPKSPGRFGRFTAEVSLVK